MAYTYGSILSKVNSPEDLRQLPEEELPTLCQDVRKYIIEVMANNPGHLAA